MPNAQSNLPVPALQVARLRHLTNLPWMECKQLLAPLSQAQRENYIAEIEAQPGPCRHDPIEDDPAIRPLFLAVCAEVDREVSEWHRQYLAELAQRSSHLAKSFSSGRGLCHRRWWRIKELLRDRHGIAWRSPPEMNPGTIFD